MSDLSKIINRYSVLKQLPIFSKLKWFELQKIAAKCVFVEYKKGEVIREQGSAPDAFYCVVSGRVKAYAVAPSGEKRDVDFIHRGMYFGIISLLTGENHSLTFEVINDVVILKLMKDDFFEILESIPRLGIEFSQSLSRRVRSPFTHSKAIFESNVISVYGPVKYSGSSTFALNLAFHLQRETSQKVIFLSLRSAFREEAVAHKKPSVSIQWKKPATDLKQIIESQQKIKDSIGHQPGSFDVLHVHCDPLDMGLAGRMSYFVSLLATDYHFVVVDMPNEMDDIVFKTLVQSDTVYLITKDEKENLRQTAHVIDRLRQELKETFTSHRVQIMISGVESKENLSPDDINQTVKFNITQTLPYFHPEDLKGAVNSDAMVAFFPDLQSDYARMLRRIARQIGGVLVGLVLGGGAALGIAHVGVIRVLEREGIPIDMVVGSSIGALIGSLWASGKNADELETIAREFEKKKAAWNLIDITPSKSGLSGKNITMWLRRHLGDTTFYQTRIPFKAVAFDLIRREELIIDSGYLVDAVRQSIAIPGVISPIVENDRLIIDGGVVNPLPTNVVAGSGIKKIIAVNVLQSPGDVVRGYEIFRKKVNAERKIPFLKAPLKYIGVRAARYLTKLVYPNIPDIIVRSLQAVEYVIAEQSAQQADVVIHPDLSGVNWFELYEVDRLIASGQEAALKHLPEIKKLISE